MQSRNKRLNTFFSTCAFKKLHKSYSMFPIIHVDSNGVSYTLLIWIRSELLQWCCESHHFLRHHLIIFSSELKEKLKKSKEMFYAGRLWVLSCRLHKLHSAWHWHGLKGQHPISNPSATCHRGVSDAAEVLSACSPSELDFPNRYAFLHSLKYSSEWYTTEVAILY